MILIERFLSFFAPASCLVCGAESRVLCLNCVQEHLQTFGERCVGCNSLSPHSKTCSSCRSAGLPAHTWVGVVYSGVATRLVYKYKFDHVRECCRVMASQMIEQMNSSLSGSGNLVNLPAHSSLSLWSHPSESKTGRQVFIGKCIVVPVPTATKRVRERGFDHAKLLARQISINLGLPYVDVLARVGQKSQVGAGRNTRINQSQKEYYAMRPKLVAGNRVLLVDDVITTGATLAVCARILRKAGATSVDAAVFAKKI